MLLGEILFKLFCLQGVLLRRSFTAPLIICVCVWLRRAIMLSALETALESSLEVTAYFLCVKNLTCC